MDTKLVALVMIQEEEARMIHKAYGKFLMELTDAEIHVEFPRERLLRMLPGKIKEKDTRYIVALLISIDEEEIKKFSDKMDEL